ncbi:MAG: AAA family ATPase [Acidiferrobacterales bacterium]|nr:AAA family ATPase [Acidiferrobacterales bacterium]
MSQIQEVRLQNFRCFHAKQSVRLTPLTFLIGDNSTGKTSFLAAMKVITDVDFVPQSVRHSNVDFRVPYDLGAFSDVVHRPSGQEDNKAPKGAI